MSLLISHLPPHAGAARQPSGQFEFKGEIALSLAFHAGDFRGAQILMDVISLMEPLNHVELVLSIAGGPETLDERDWMDFRQKCLGLFKTVRVNKARLKYAQDNGESRDWRPNNLMFRDVATYMGTLAYGKTKDKAGVVHDDPRNVHIGAFYYLEPDCAILKRDWFTQLCAEYKACRKPFMGVVRNTARVVRDGKSSSLPPHLNGSAIYANPVWIKEHGGQALIQAALNDDPLAFPFDVLAGPTVVPRSKNTKLIYVDFSSMPTKLNPEAVVWHGDKQYQTNLATIERETGVPVERLPGEMPPSLLTEAPQEEEMELHGVNSFLGTFTEETGAPYAVPRKNPPAMEVTADKKKRFLQNQIARQQEELAKLEAEERLAAGQSEQMHEESRATPFQDSEQAKLNAPVASSQAALHSDPQTTGLVTGPRRPEAAYRAILEEVGNDPLAWARAQKWFKAQRGEVKGKKK